LTKCTSCRKQSYTSNLVFRDEISLKFLALPQAPYYGSVGTLAGAPSKKVPLKGPLETKLCQIMLLSEVSSQKISIQILVPHKEFLDNQGLHLIAKYELVGLIYGPPTLPQPGSQTFLIRPRLPQFKFIHVLFEPSRRKYIFFF